ncbi:cuticle protein 6-like [Homarus americanus]|nr:cuticle protein 6-like [Homarus americanus]
MALAAARRNTVYEFETDDQTQEQEGHPGSSVRGSYSWMSPTGVIFTVEYVADELGFRVTKSNAVPLTHGGVAADGNQGSFVPQTHNSYRYL